MNETVTSDLSGKIALVTGAGRGIGRAIALKLAEAGCRVALNDLPDDPSARQTATEMRDLGYPVMPVFFNVADAAAVKTGIQSIVSAWGGLDILVNNAGILRDSLFQRLSEKDWDCVMEVNLKGPFLCSKLALNSMISGRWGRIINIASVAGVMGNMGSVNYSASKGGLAAFTRALAAEVGSRGITVNAVAPGFIETGLTAELPPAYRDAVVSRTALRRAGTPREVADLAAFLASERAAYITGQVICVDGGL